MTILCVLCKKEKSVDQFYKHKGGWADGLDHRCKNCNVVRGQIYYKNNLERCRANARKSHYKNREKKIERMRLYGKKQKELILNHYGKGCACCGEREIVFLTIDHINGGGTKHRKSLSGGGRFFYRWIIKNNFPSGLRVLCFNCNSGRALNKGICPHEEVKLKGCKGEGLESF